MFLAEQFGYPKWRQLQEYLSAAEWAEWETYYRLNPPGSSERLDYMLAQIAYMLYASKGGKKNKLSDFMPYVNKPKKKKQTVEQQKAIAKAIANMGKKR